MRILAIDDDPNFRGLLQVFLARLNFHDVEFAASGPEALHAIATSPKPFECFLCDIQMEPINGIDLVRRIRTMPQHHSTPILMISTLSEKASIDQAFLAGANDYITKPLDFIELKARLSMALLVVYERSQARLMQQRVEETENTWFATMRFDREVAIEGVPGVVSSITIENYLLRQGYFRLRRSGVLGFHFPMAKPYFDALDPAYFHDLLADITQAISATLRRMPHIIAYTGSGDFISVLLEGQDVTRAALQKDIDANLGQLQVRYRNMDLPMPTLFVGEPARMGLYPFECPSKLIGKAQRNARARANMMQKEVA